MFYFTWLRALLRTFSKNDYQRIKFYCREVGRTEYHFPSVCFSSFILAAFIAQFGCWSVPLLCEDKVSQYRAPTKYYIQWNNPRRFDRTIWFSRTIKLGSKASSALQIEVRPDPCVYVSRGTRLTFPEISDRFFDTSAKNKPNGANSINFESR